MRRGVDAQGREKAADRDGQMRRPRGFLGLIGEDEWQDASADVAKMTVVAGGYSSSSALLLQQPTRGVLTVFLPHPRSSINPLNASCSKLLLFKRLSAILV